VAVRIIHHQRMAGAGLGNELTAGAFHGGQTQFTFNHGSPRSFPAQEAPQSFRMMKGHLAKWPELGWRNCALTGISLIPNR
jgi:hypothetical protein